MKALKEGACTLFFRPRTRPKTFLQCFALDQRKCKAKHCRNVLGRVLGRKNKVQKLSLNVSGPIFFWKKDCSTGTPLLRRFLLGRISN